MEQVSTELAAKVADATGLDAATARQALEAGDPELLDLAKSLVELDETKDEWHASMARHRAKLAGV